MDETFILNYVSDISDVISKANQIQKINKDLAAALSRDFSKAIDSTSRQLDKINFDKTFKIKNVDTGEFKKVTADVNQFSSTVKLADGTLGKFVQKEAQVEGETIKLGSSFTVLKAKIDPLIGTSSKLATNFTRFSDVNSKFAKQLSGLGTVSKFLGTTLSQITDSGSRVTKVFETNTGKIVALTEVTKKLPNGIQDVTRTTKEMNKAQLANITTMERGKLVTRGFADNLGTLLKRAALTIPVWFAIRQGIGSIFRTIRDGLKDIIEFERSLEKIRRNIQGTGPEIAEQLGVAREEITRLAIESGKSAVEISGAVKQFATIGFTLEESLGLAATATKASVLLFEDAGKTAEAFARSFKVLQDTSAGAKSTQEQFNEAIALTVKLGETNADNLGEINEALLKSASSARTAGLSMNELIILLQTLATAGRSGSQAGTLLSTSLNELLGSLDELAPKLGVVVKDGDSTFQILGKILEASEKFFDAGAGTSQRAIGIEAFGEIFGGERGTKIISSLSAVNKLFKENSKVLPDFDETNKDFEALTKSIAVQADRFVVLNQEIGKAFVNGIVGGEDFAKSLEKINKLLEGTVKNAEFVGDTIRKAFAPSNTRDVLTNNIFTNLLDRVTGQDLQNAVAASAQTTEKAGADISKNIIKGFRKELSAEDLAKLIGDIEVIGAKQLGFDEATLERALERLKIEAQIVKAKENQNGVSERAVELSQKQKDDLKKIDEVLLSSSQERFRLQGATEAQLLKQELSLRKQLGLELEGAELLDKKLQLERAINEERRLSADLSSDSVKLFKIAQTEGVGVAKAVGEALSGQIDFNNFLRTGGRAVQVFKEQFTDIFESQQAKAFFKGETFGGQPSLRGGFGIPIQEEALRQRGIPSVDVQTSLAQRAAIREFLAPQIQQSNTINQTININSNETRSEQLAKEILEAFRKELKVPSSDLAKDLKTFVEEK